MNSVEQDNIGEAVLVFDMQDRRMNIGNFSGRRGVGVGRHFYLSEEIDRSAFISQQLFQFLFCQTGLGRRLRRVDQRAAQTIGDIFDIHRLSVQYHPC